VPRWEVTSVAFHLKSNCRDDPEEKPAASPRRVLVQESLVLAQLGKAQFAPDDSSQTDQASTEEAQGTRFGNHEVEVGIATGEVRAAVKQVCAGVDGDLRGRPTCPAALTKPPVRM
jgi:hypothetical protein